MKQYKLKSREFVTQFWRKLGTFVTDDYLTENEFKIFTYTTEEIEKKREVDITSSVFIINV